MIGHQIGTVFDNCVVPKHLKRTNTDHVINKITIVGPLNSLCHTTVSTVTTTAAGNLQRAILSCELTGNRAGYIPQELIQGLGFVIMAVKIARTEHRRVGIPFLYVLDSRRHFLGI